ncbi:FAD-dependent monooxygenase [Bradyrhizobium commune]|uniref:FAD-dependent monooxygenase n=1 Tax=Bradyrhizobium commune TaxID=83627 RepID=A0A7S9D3S2_9BRAD|nr:FAD-dependent monooxygenase [Bradyrhizobium commune]QPF90667.1 FAD-dependent monooxygenase [Bradyrhizobium commune]
MPTGGARNIKILGAGPAGLYAAYRLKRLFPEANVSVIEQNMPDVTFGFGVVFSAQGLQFLADDDAELVRSISAGLESWEDIEIRVGGERIRIDGIGFTAISRVTLLRILNEKVREVGIIPTFGKSIADPSELGEADLIVAADGANSVLRSRYEAEFGTRVDMLTNWFAWFGASRPFDALTQTFKFTDHGPFNAHHYRFSPTHSTFLVETTADNFERCALASLPLEESRVLCERLFADDLDGAQLISNRSIWRQFPKITNVRWFHKNIVLVGDALRTAHYSIGSGTRLALEDVQALVGAIASTDGDIAAALPLYEERRRPVVQKLLDAASRSADWYEHFAENMNRPAWDFAMDYISRSGRVDPTRLASICPAFIREYERRKARRQPDAGTETGAHSSIP